MGVFALGLVVTVDGAAPETVTIDQRDMMAALQAGWPMPNEAANTLERIGFLRAAAGSWWVRNRGGTADEFEAACSEVTPAGEAADPDPTPLGTSGG